MSCLLLALAYKSRTKGSEKEVRKEGRKKRRQEMKRSRAAFFFFSFFLLFRSTDLHIDFYFKQMYLRPLLTMQVENFLHAFDLIFVSSGR